MLAPGQERRIIVSRHGRRLRSERCRRLLWRLSAALSKPRADLGRGVGRVPFSVVEHAGLWVFGTPFPASNPGALAILKGGS